jgi:hypothetical protein
VNRLNEQSHLLDTVIRRLPTLSTYLLLAPGTSIHNAVAHIFQLPGIVSLLKQGNRIAELVRFAPADRRDPNRIDGYRDATLPLRTALSALAHSPDAPNLIFVRDVLARPRPPLLTQVPQLMSANAFQGMSPAEASEWGTLLLPLAQLHMLLPIVRESVIVGSLRSYSEARHRPERLERVLSELESASGASRTPNEQFIFQTV